MGGLVLPHETQRVVDEASQADIGRAHQAGRSMTSATSTLASTSGYASTCGRTMRSILQISSGSKRAHKPPSITTSTSQTLMVDAITEDMASNAFSTTATVCTSRWCQTVDQFVDGTAGRGGIAAGDSGRTHHGAPARIHFKAAATAATADGTTHVDGNMTQFAAEP